MLRVLWYHILGVSWAGEVSKIGKVIYELVVRYISGLGKAVHSLADINKDVVIFDEREEAVGVNYFLGNHLDVYAHVFVSCH